LPQTILVQPEKQSKRKTDRRDASALSELLWVNRHRLLAGQGVKGLRRIELPTAEDAENRQLTTVRQRLGQLRTRTINRIKHLLRKHNLEQAQPAKGLDTLRTRKWLKGLRWGDGPPGDGFVAFAVEAVDEQMEQIEAEIRQRQPQHAVATVLRRSPGARPIAAWRWVRGSRHPAISPSGELGQLLGSDAGCRNSAR